MIHYQNFSKKITFLICIFSWFETAFANFNGYPQIGVDGSNNIAAVWRTDLNTGLSKIQGVYGPPGTLGTATDLSDATSNAITPQLAVSTSSQATTKAAAIWQAKDSSGNFVIQVATYNSISGWSSSTTLSATDGSEMIREIYHVSISPDGSTIGANWAATMVLTGNTVIRYAYSTNGGVNWTIDQQMSP